MSPLASKDLFSYVIRLRGEWNKFVSHVANLFHVVWSSKKTGWQKLGILAVQPLGGERKELAETWQGKIIGL